MDDSGGETGTEDVTDAELIRLAIESELFDVHHSIPARVDAFDWNNGSPIVKVTPLVQRRIADGDGGYTPESLPQLQDVPVKYYRCGKFFSVFPLEKGDTGALVFCDQNIGTWRATGNVSDPGDIKRHGLDGAYFTPGLFDDLHGMQSDPGSAMLMGRNGTDSAQIEITDTEIHLGKGATKEAARNGDGTDNGTLVFNPGSGGASLAFIPPGGVVPPPGPTINIPLTGKINEGSAHVKVED